MVVAILALIQPWLTTLYRHRRGRIEIYEDGRLEVGYSTFGPTLGLYGTLRACDREFFVRSVTLHLVKCKDRSQHTFDWIMFRAFGNLAGDSNVTLELPTGFMLLTAQPHRYNIVFADQATQREMRIELDRIRQAWGVYLTASVHSKTDSDGEHPTDEKATIESRRAVHVQFATTPESTRAYREINRLFYWEKGDYELEVVVKSESPDRTWRKKWRFALTDGEVELLQFNTLNILEEAVGLPSQNPYFFAYPEYGQLEP